MSDGRIPGAVLHVARDGDVLFAKAYGWAQAYAYGAGQYDDPGGIEALDDPVPMETRTVFDLASVTKVLGTTMAAMLLVDRGALDVDAPVSRYLPDFSGGGKEGITVRHLLTHTSGLRQWVPTYYHGSTPDEAYAYMVELPLGWPVGEGRHYSDLGFMVLGRIVEGISGRPLDDFLRSELYQPLGLAHTGFRPREGAPTDDEPASPAGGTAPAFAATSHGNPYERRMVHDPDFGYRIEGDPDAWAEWRRHTLVGEVNDGNAFYAFGGVAGHAGLFSSAQEAAHLVRLLLDRGTLDGVRYLDPATVDAFLEAALPGQALGWQLPDYAPGGSFGHTGFTGTFVLGVPADRLVVVLLTNRQNLGVDEETRYPDLGPLQQAVTEALTRSGTRGR